MSDLFTLPYEDRLYAAGENLRLIYERRDSFLSDSNVIEAADDWTTDTWSDDDGFVGGDHERLYADLVELTTPQDAEEETS